MKDHRLQFKFEYYLTRFFAGIFCLLPYSWASAVGMALGGFAYRTLKIRRKVALDNLKQAFPEKSPEELDRIAYESYRHWGGVGAEYARLPKFRGRLQDKYVVFDGKDVLNEAVAGGKGGLVISGHLGNWEIMGAVVSAEKYGVTYIVASQANKLVDKLMDDVRRQHGIEIWKMKEAPRGTFKSLKNNRFVCIMIDQDAGRECVWVDFFGKKASTHRGAAVFHLKTGSPLLLTSCLRTNPQSRPSATKLENDSSRESINTVSQENPQRGSISRPSATKLENDSSRESINSVSQMNPQSGSISRPSATKLENGSSRESINSVSQVNSYPSADGQRNIKILDSRFRGNDGTGAGRGFCRLSVGGRINYESTAQQRESNSVFKVKSCHYRINFEKIEIPPFEGSVEEKNIFIMQYLTKLLEEQIRQHPEQYFWMHKRWKTKPPGNISK